MFVVVEDVGNMMMIMVGIVNNTGVHLHNIMWEVVGDKADSCNMYVVIDEVVVGNRDVIDIEVGLFEVVEGCCY